MTEREMPQVSAIFSSLELKNRFFVGVRNCLILRNRRWKPHRLKSAIARLFGNLTTAGPDAVGGPLSRCRLSVKTCILV